MLYEEGDATRGLNLYLYDRRLYAGGWNRPTGESGWEGTFISTAQWESTHIGGAGQWHHVALVLSGGETVTDGALTLYVDGRLIGSGPGSQLWGHGSDIGLGGAGGQAWWDATRFHDGPPTYADDWTQQTFKGLLDEVRVYNRALTAEQVRGLAGGGDVGGDSWAGAYPTLQQALGYAGAGDEIWVAEGVYTPTLPSEFGGMSDLERYSTFRMVDGVALYGGFARTETAREQRDWRSHVTVLSGDLSGNDNGSLAPGEPTRADNALHVVTSQVGQLGAVLDGFTITGGHSNLYSDWSGAGIHHTSGALTLAHSQILSNTAVYSTVYGSSRGGGVYAFAEGSNQVSLTIMESTLRANHATGAGGGLFLDAWGGAALS